MHKLKSLGLSHTPLTKLTCYNNIPLEELYVNDTMIDSIGTFFMSNLKILSAANT